MKREEIKVCVLRVGGTNCDAETKRAFEDLGVKAEIVHMNEIVKRRNLLEYNVLVFPGGFSYGDYVRAGAIWAKWILAKLGKELKAFVDENRPILGICNGFQVLVEAGLLPGFDGISHIQRLHWPLIFRLATTAAGFTLNMRTMGNAYSHGKFQEEKFCGFQWLIQRADSCSQKKRRKQFLKGLYENDQLSFPLLQ